MVQDRKQKWFSKRVAKLLWSRRGSRNRSIRREEDGLATYQVDQLMVDTEEVIPIDKGGGYKWDQAVVDTK